MQRGWRRFETHPLFFFTRGAGDEEGIAVFKNKGGKKKKKSNQRMKVLAAPRDATGVREDARCCEGRGDTALELQAPSCFAVFGEKILLQVEEATVFWELSDHANCNISPWMQQAI